MERIVIISQIEAPSLPPTPFSILQPPVFQSPQSFDVDTKISSNILLIIVILAVIFFISGLVHLMVRFIVIANNRDPNETENDVTALQGQLQQLFILHDAGVDQSFIDALPIFHYKSILGVKDPFDCAVCLCEFEHEDYLRLLPKCSHAFHIDCIDTWLLSHSTCPLCRASLLADFASPQAACNPAVCILESGRDSSREVAINGSDPGSANDGDLGCEISLKLEEGAEKIVTVKLGKFKSVADGSGESSNNKNVNSRRCFSMGSVAYVMDETTSLQVPIIGTLAGSIKKRTGAVSEYGSDSKRELKEINIESFSISKVWPRSMDCSKRVFSYRFGGRRRTICDVNEETQSCYSGESHHQPMASAATGTTLRWLLSKHQNKFTQSSSSSNV